MQKTAIGSDGRRWRAAGPAIEETGSRYITQDAMRLQQRAKLRTAVEGSEHEALTGEEQEDLLLMREEEKLARDVYIRLYEQWGLRPFDHISGAEKMHMDAVLALLTLHALPDPVEGLGVAAFSGRNCSSCMISWCSRASESPVEAVRVGLLIEELDIKGLKGPDGRTSKPWIRAVYAELEHGSRNHLRTFYRWKQRLRAAYTPQHLAPEEFERTALSAHETCWCPGPLAVASSSSRLSFTVPLTYRRGRLPAWPARCTHTHRRPRLPPGVAVPVQPEARCRFFDRLSGLVAGR
ncbi:protein of unknown function [Candidatus Hydrogenisulfobacillus filiaventi]|uniref:DUF2202 domain-containing protein n=1 Tax=Candidatus Hydrogenisulfobacillus filiaventi TaxID=2707344 RepID=A0A6F8ZG79_9FIRM|nr:protein of unknown function [Candidatus Hydrogenisulfobacillus filiaventi]